MIFKKNFIFLGHRDLNRNHSASLEQLGHISKSILGHIENKLTFLDLENVS